MDTPPCLPRFVQKLHDKNERMRLSGVFLPLKNGALITLFLIFFTPFCTVFTPFLLVTMMGIAIGIYLIYSAHSYLKGGLMSLYRQVQDLLNSMDIGTHKSVPMKKPDLVIYRMTINKVKRDRMFVTRFNGKELSISRVY